MKRVWQLVIMNDCSNVHDMCALPKGTYQTAYEGMRLIPKNDLAALSEGLTRQELQCDISKASKEGWIKMDLRIVCL